MAYTDASLKRANMRPANGCELPVLHMYAALRCHQAFCSSYTLLPSLKAVVYGTAHRDGCLPKKSVGLSRAGHKYCRDLPAVTTNLPAPPRMKLLGPAQGERRTPGWVLFTARAP